MAHKHPVYDTDKHFVIDPITKKISTECPKIVLPQHSHNSERFTFELPKEVEGHDMSLCNLVEVHFQNIDATNKENNSFGIYKVDDLQADGDIVYGSWLIEGDSTYYAGGLIFALHFACISDAGEIEYNLPTLSYSAITIGQTVWNNDTIAKQYPDIITDFEARIKALENGKGEPGDRGTAMYILKSELAGTSEYYFISDLVIPSGYTPMVGDIVLFRDGNFGQINEVDTDNKRVLVGHIPDINLSVPDEGDGDSGEEGSSGTSTGGIAMEDQDIHAKYFTITDDGVLSLKPEYRGACPTMRSTYTDAISDNGLDAAGSMNTLLPEILYVPQVVDEIAVTRLVDGIFLYNEAIEAVVLPQYTTEIPSRFCDNAHRLKQIYNTEHIETIGNAAFQYTHLIKAEFPNLQSMGEFTLNACPFLVYADIGNVTSIPKNGFCGCMVLSRIKGGANVTTVEKNAFNLCYRLNSVEFLPNLTSIGDNAFLRCRLRFDWASLQNCTFGNKATALQLNPTDIWSACNVTPVENPVPTLLSQGDMRWREKQMGTSGYAYSEGCTFFTAMHIYCALNNVTANTVEDFEAIANSIDPSILNDFSPAEGNVKTICEKLGLNVEHYTEHTQESLQALYDGLAQGKYAEASLAARYGSSMGHSAMIYGVNDKREWLIADSARSAVETIGDGDMTIKYPMCYQNCAETFMDVTIVSK